MVAPASGGGRQLKIKINHFKDQESIKNVLFTKHSLEKLYFNHFIFDI